MAVSESDRQSLFDQEDLTPRDYIRLAEKPRPQPWRLDEISRPAPKEPAPKKGPPEDLLWLATRIRELGEQRVTATVKAQADTLRKEWYALAGRHPSWKEKKWYKKLRREFFSDDGIFARIARAQTR